MHGDTPSPRWIGTSQGSRGQRSQVPARARVVDFSGGRAGVDIARRLCHRHCQNDSEGSRVRSGESVRRPIGAASAGRPRGPLRPGTGSRTPGRRGGRRTTRPLGTPAPFSVGERPGEPSLVGLSSDLQYRHVTESLRARAGFGVGLAQPLEQRHRMNPKSLAICSTVTPGSRPGATRRRHRGTHGVGLEHSNILPVRRHGKPSQMSPIGAADPRKALHPPRPEQGGQAALGPRGDGLDTPPS
jgi:hypothetical protein